MLQTAPTWANIESAHEIVSKYGHRTPIWTCETLDRMSNMKLFFKCENFQKTGAFKFRGAINAVSKLNGEERTRGVVTHSSGNHAAALTRAAALHGISAYVVMPENSSKIKIEAVKEYGGEITLCAPTLADRENTASEIQSRTGATLIPPFNHPDVIAGQGTCAKELFEDVDNLDAIIVPIGGGGLMAGSCLTSAFMSPNTKVIGAEPKNADDAWQSLKSGELKPQLAPNTIADGLRTSLGDLTWPIIKRHVEQIVCVSESEIIETMKLFFERTKLLIEPSCCVAVAAGINGQIKTLDEGSRIGVIITGGNVDLANLPF